jgi:hypothetical protein
MTDLSPPADGYDASILGVLAGLDPPPTRSSVMFGDKESCNAAIEDLFARGKITADEMAAQLAWLHRQDMA